MNLQGININLVRNEYEYNKYVAEDYRSKYDYEASKASLPWLIIDFSSTLEEYGADRNKVTVEFSADANFTNLGSDYEKNGFAVKLGDTGKFEFDAQRFGRLMLEAKKDCGLDTVPANMEVKATDALGNVFTAKLSGLDLTDKTTLLGNIDKYIIQQGDSFVGKLLYEIVAQKL